MNEQKLTKKVRDLAKTLRREGHPVWDVKIHGGPYQEVGIPDILMCVYGIFVAIELKSPEGKGAALLPSPAQSKQLTRIEEAGGMALCCHDYDVIEGWLREICGLYAPGAETS